jgi:CRP-like cAMP-binding protein
MIVADTETTRREPRNSLLMLLPEKSRQALPPLEEVMLETGAILYEPDEVIEHVYFPDDALVSIQSLGADGSTLEICMIGREGMVGVQAILGGRTPYRAFVQTGGRASRMKCLRLNEGEANANKAFQTLLLKYTNVFLVQVAQSSLCTCFHPLQERICRWLLMASDAVGTTTLHVTHDTIAQLLGTRRASVTGTAGLLQKAGLIRMSRGQITILDRDGLAEMACECYGILKNEVRQLATK